MLLWTIAGAVLVAGYTMLWHGGTTLPAALLSIGYCALVPLAISRAGRRGPGSTPSPAGEGRTAYLGAGATALAVLALYVLTLAPSTAMWDTSEYLAAVRVLGLPHPPGNPLFILVAHAFAAIPLAASYAVRVNLFAAVCSACAAGLWFLIAWGSLSRALPSTWARMVGAATTVAVSATTFTVWNQSVVNEKVYTVSLAQLVLVLWLGIRWARDPRGAQAHRLLWLCLYLCGLGYAIHPAGLLGLAPIGVLVLARRPAVLFESRRVAAGAGLFLLGLTPFIYEPIRAAWDPAINEGEPTACAGHIAVGCTLSGETLVRLKANVNREQYGKPPLTVRQAPFTAQLGMWWLYWRWQWFRDSHDALPGVQLTLALLALGLAAVGSRAQWRDDRTGWLGLAAMIATVTPLLIFYLNFKYGWSQSIALGNTIPREVRDRDYFYIWSFSSLGIWVGLGLVTVWQAAAKYLGPSGLARGTPVLVMAVIPGILNARDASRAGELFTRDWAYDVLESARPGAVLVTAGDNDTFPLWYAQSVEGIRPDVTVIVTTHLGTDWAPWQLARRIPPDYDKTAGPAIWRNEPIPAHRPVLTADRASLDKVAQETVFSDPMVFLHGGIRAKVGPGSVRRDQMLLLSMIGDAFPDRPFEFTNPGDPSDVGLAPYLRREGLLWRLMDQPIVDSTNSNPTEGIDVGVTLELWRNVYRGAAQITREGDWVDLASVSIPYYYVSTGIALAQALNVQKRETEAAVVQAQIGAVFAAARIQRLLSSPVTAGPQ